MNQIPLFSECSEYKTIRNGLIGLRCFLADLNVLVLSHQVAEDSTYEEQTTHNSSDNWCFHF